MSLSSMQFGIVLASNGNAFKILQQQMFPELDQEERDGYNTILQSSAVVGLGIGSLVGGTMMGNGKRRLVITYNYLALVASFLSLFAGKTFWLLCISRFFHGYFTGILVNAAPKIIEETVPAHVMDKGFGISTNLFINVAVMSTLLLGVGLPPEEKYATSNYWMIFYG